MTTSTRDNRPRPGEPAAIRDPNAFAFLQAMPADNEIVSSAPEPETSENDANTRIEYYRHVVESGVHKLFEQRATLCPMCTGSELVREQTLRDFVLLKPGYFHMSRCRSCGHIFQNPRLNAQGLEFYYRDFYTGTGEESVRGYLASTTASYRARALMLKGHQPPRRWLDVGAGYGHFSRTAREVWRETKFHVLDVSASIKSAENLGWAERAYVGAFLDLAPQIEETYDVVSMFHYLEHTPDPLAELRAAASLVEPNGLLLIEVPDPDSVGRRLMGKWWPSWFAPQHLHFFPSHNMETYLRTAGFEPILWHRAKAHLATDASFAMANYLLQWASTSGLPWNVSGPQGPKTGQSLINLVRGPIRFTMTVLDKLLDPLRYLPRWPNTYRVLARKTGTGERAS